jgi:TM2 domain-containing membrane protein YozV
MDAGVFECMSIVPSDKRVPAGVLGIVLGGLGVHKFYLGYVREGLTMLIVSLVTGWLTFGVGPAVMWAIGIAEGIIYLTRSDSEFYSTYQVGRKGWF